MIAAPSAALKNGCVRSGLRTSAQLPQPLGVDLADAEITPSQNVRRMRKCQHRQARIPGRKQLERALESRAIE